MNNVIPITYSPSVSSENIKEEEDRNIVKRQRAGRIKVYLPSEHDLLLMCVW